jgi:hypothetical protein
LDKAQRPRLRRTAVEKSSNYGGRPYVPGLRSNVLLQDWYPFRGGLADLRGAPTTRDSG